jgi:hypothetical protein
MMPGISAIKPKQNPSAMISTSKNRFRSRALAQAAAATPALALISTPHAQTIIWSGVLNQPVATDNPIAQTTPLDFNQNSSADDFEAFVSGANERDEGNILSLGANTSSKSSSNGFLYRDDPVGTGTLIDSSLASSFGGVHPALYASGPQPDTINPGESKYYAFAQYDGGQAHYGWMQLSLSADGLTGTLNQWAYNSTAGESILAGQTSAVPEPATYGVMCGIALAGWAAARRSRGKPSVV